VVLQLVVPKKLSDEQRRLLAEYAQTERTDVNSARQSIWDKINPFGN
jgi:DnaJ-class molecular chaperone